jgi:hypothetical protein
MSIPSAGEKMNYRRLRLIVLLLVLFTTPSVIFGQPLPAKSTPATRQDVLRLFKVMHINDQMRSVMDSMTKQQSALVHETMKKRYPQIAEERLEQFDAMMEESMKDFPVDAIIDDLIPVYQKHLTRTDISAMNVFYASPTGQKLLREMPAMTSESMQLSYGRMQKQMDAMMDRMQKMMKEEDLNRKAPPTPTKPDRQ